MDKTIAENMLSTNLKFSSRLERALNSVAVRLNLEWKDTHLYSTVEDYLDRKRGKIFNYEKDKNAL